MNLASLVVGVVIVVLAVALLPAGQMPGFGLGTLAGGVESLACWYAMKEPASAGKLSGTAEIPPQAAKTLLGAFFHTWGKS